ncbi:hypothetical protein ACE38W_20515 [Chitinophaga sp. Hz27]|uniref:hypothetical protein n=1 Tax=Chitinophaga sp. Hz27 TaxID=3347169 RepID=UPI0035DFA714
MNLKHATIISKAEFETPELLAVKSDRTIAEYCWTCTASTIWHAIKHFGLDNCAYLDADMLFFSSPDPIYQELENKSVGITSHNFSPDQKSYMVYGKYCVQFVFFRNDKDGMAALDWWRKSCIEWCYARLEDVRYGDQKYLEYFEEKFNNVCVITHPGVGVAPWNFALFKAHESNGQVLLTTKKAPIQTMPVIFYHYQGLKFVDDGNEIKADAAFMKISSDWLKYTYTPYIKLLAAAQDMVTGKKPVERTIIFTRTVSKSISAFVKLKLKRFKIVRSIFYAVKKSRYDQPKGIGGSI